jgi:prepilin-type N-terminal cleavage/methylation domain-containing protein
MERLFSRQRGVTLLELLVVLMILSLILTAAVKTWDVTLERGRAETTAKKLNQLATAITGDRDYIIAGRRADFGFVGDFGRLPNTLAELTVSPQVLPPESSRWRGPYLRSTFNQSADGYRIDGWGDSIIYNRDSMFLRSYGGRGLADPTRWQTVRLPFTSNEMTRNDVNGTVLDVRGLPPPDTLLNSLMVSLSYPFEGKLQSRELSGSAYLHNGQFQYQTIPQGTHRLRAMFVNSLSVPAETTTTDVDVTVYPGMGARDLRVRLNLNWATARHY